jgi:hypothetical protein
MPIPPLLALDYWDGKGDITDFRPFFTDVRR